MCITLAVCKKICLINLKALIEFGFILFLGPIRRFKRICEHIQAQILGRRPNHSPRISRRPTGELSESSSCGSESMSPTPSRHQVANDDMAVASISMTACSAGASAMSRCKSDQDATADIFEREAKMVTTSHRGRAAPDDVRPLLNGRRMSYDLKNSSKDKLWWRLEINYHNDDDEI